MNPGGQKKITRAVYDSLSPYNQGYASYMQAAWNPEVPKKCPFKSDSQEAVQRADGQHAAYLAVLELEE